MAKYAIRFIFRQAGTKHLPLREQKSMITGRKNKMLKSVAALIIATIILGSLHPGMVETFAEETESAQTYEASEDTEQVNEASGLPEKAAGEEETDTPPAFEEEPKETDEELPDSIQETTADLSAARAALEEVIYQAEQFEENDYTAASYAELSRMIDIGKEVLSDADATKGQYEEAVALIAQAAYDLETMEGLSELEELISAAKELDISGFTAESREAFQAVVAAAEAVAADESAEEETKTQMAELIKTAALALVQTVESSKVYDGLYSIDGWLQHAAANQKSMGNNALVKPMQIRVQGGAAALLMEFVPLTTSLGKASFTGYLAYLNYFPGWEGGETGYSVPNAQTPVPVSVEEYYEGVYDAYNDPETGVDANIKGNYYPHYMSMPLDWNDPEVWVQVYVPVMEAIQTGGGKQYAKLQLDWTTLERTEDPDIDKTALEAAMEDAAAQRSSLKVGDSGYTAENLNALDKAIANAKAACESLYVSQDEIDAVKAEVSAVMELFGVAVLSVEPATAEIAAGETQQIKAEVVNGTGYSITYTSSIPAIAAVSETGVITGVAAGSTEITVSASVEGGETLSRTIKVTVTASDGSDGTWKLDPENLQDGIYKVHGDMVKVNKTEASMSDNAINHTIKLTVKDGQYTITMDFNGLTVGTQLGYLGTLKYFKTGYTQDVYGAPQGTTAEVTVDSVQVNADGSKVEDDYGTDYPDKVTFELIPEALEDGYVPLQVFVPIMEAISEGSGTQPVYLVLDWDTLEETTEDDADFNEDESTDDTSPAVDITDKATGVHVTAAAGILPEGVTLVVKQITEGVDYETVKKNTFISGNSFVLYDISFLDASGKEVQPSGRVSVGIPLPSEWDTAKLAAYHFTDSGAASPIVGTAADGVYTFTSSSFSKFAVVQRSGSTLPTRTPGATLTASPTKSAASTLSAGSGSSLSTATKSTSAKTGDTANLGGWVLAAAAAISLAIAAVALRRKKQRF